MGFKLFVARHLATAQNKTAIFMGQGDYDVFDPNEYVDTFELNGINECLLLSSPLRRAIQTSQDIMSQKKMWCGLLCYMIQLKKEDLVNLKESQKQS